MLNRNYEVSIWTLQDGFISILKPFNVELKGQLEEPDMNIKDDGTEEFKFSIPMYLYNKEEDISVKQPNPLWSNVVNGTLLANMRKIKVIFDKRGNNEKVFEFLILKITERHEEDQLFCDVECEGLAFHELGKIGYKLSLSYDDFELDYEEWADNPWEEVNGEMVLKEEPLATLQYWNNKIFNGRTDWRYEIRIKNTENNCLLPGKVINKIYEEPYVSSWEANQAENGLVATNTEMLKEKARASFDLKESNIYNITQNLAEAFGVFCKYEYHYDDNYHIIDRVVVYYNNFISEEEGMLDITYPYDTDDISREMDSTDTITKMFVTSVDDDTTAEGKITIMDVEANKSLEDYLLNFDYLHSNGAITEEQYQELNLYEYEMHIINKVLINLSSKIDSWERQLPELEAQQKVLEESVRLDLEKYNEADDFLRTLTSGTGRLQLAGASCDKAVVVEDLNPKQASHKYYARLREKGIEKDTIKVYQQQNYTGNNPLSDEYTNFVIGCDEFGSAVEIYNLPSNLVNSLIYVTYWYQPSSQYEKLKRMYASKWVKDKEDLDKISKKITAMKEQLEEAYTVYQNRLEEKEQIMKDFEAMMGPALREGYWTPEDYTDYGNKYSDEISIPFTSSSVSGTSKLLDFIWSSDIQEDEQKNYYYLGLNMDKQYYPCIECTDAILNYISYCKTNNKTLVLSFFETDADAASNNDCRRVSYAIGSQLQYAFLKNKITNQITPVLMVTGAESLGSFVINEVNQTLENSLVDRMVGTAQLGYFNSVTTTTTIAGTNEKVSMEEITFEPLNSQSLTWINSLDSYDIVYPRLRINSLKLKTAESELKIHYNYIQLVEFQDYYSFSDEEEENWYYYITLKPDVLFLKGMSDRKVNINYSISNANIAIYLDAIQVLKENSQPKVSYTVKIQAVEKKQHLKNNTKFLTEHTYQLLNYIANINDTQLKFKNVQGYISEIHLKLDNPSEDEVVIQNYKTKFEDLFSNIVAQSEAMKKNSYTFGAISDAFNPVTNTFNGEVFQQSIARADLNLSFNSGKLTIDDTNGIWAISDSGAVAMSGGGIFTATEQDSNGNWKWNTGILPSGINASLITTGQLDTNKIRIFSGNQLRFQWNGDGLFAYKSYYEDLADKIVNTVPAEGSVTEEIFNQLANQQNILDEIDVHQYVKLDQNGLFLIAEEGSKILKAVEVPAENEGEESTINYEYDELTGTSLIKRVEVSWNGFKLRNWENKEVFYADPDTGNLNIEGKITATALKIGNGNLLNIDADNGLIQFQVENFDNETYDNSITLSGGGIIINSGAQLALGIADIETDLEELQNDVTNLKQDMSDELVQVYNGTEYYYTYLNDYIGRLFKLGAFVANSGTSKDDFYKYNNEAFIRYLESEDNEFSLEDNSFYEALENSDYSSYDSWRVNVKALYESYKTWYKSKTNTNNWLTIPEEKDFIDNDTWISFSAHAVKKEQFNDKFDILITELDNYITQMNTNPNTVRARDQDLINAWEDIIVLQDIILADYATNYATIQAEVEVYSTIYNNISTSKAEWATQSDLYQWQQYQIWLKNRDLYNWQQYQNWLKAKALFDYQQSEIAYNHDMACYHWYQYNTAKSLYDWYIYEQDLAAWTAYQDWLNNHEEGETYTNYHPDEEPSPPSGGKPEGYEDGETYSEPTLPVESKPQDFSNSVDYSEPEALGTPPANYSSSNTYLDPGPEYSPHPNSEPTDYDSTQNYTSPSQEPTHPMNAPANYDNSITYDDPGENFTDTIYDNLVNAGAAFTIFNNTNLEGSVSLTENGGEANQKVSLSEYINIERQLDRINNTNVAKIRNIENFKSGLLITDDTFLLRSGTNPNGSDALTFLIDSSNFNLNEDGRIECKGVITNMVEVEANILTKNLMIGTNNKALPVLTYSTNPEDYDANVIINNSNPINTSNYKTGTIWIKPGKQVKSTPVSVTKSCTFADADGDISQQKNYVLSGGNKEANNGNYTYTISTTDHIKSRSYTNTDTHRRKVWFCIQGVGSIYMTFYEYTGQLDKSVSGTLTSSVWVGNMSPTISVQGGGNYHSIRNGISLLCQGTYISTEDVDGWAASTVYVKQ